MVFDLLNVGDFSVPAVIINNESRLDSSMTTRLYRIICLKRSEFAPRNEYEYLSDWLKACNLVYWRPNARGYTSAAEGAGLYTASSSRSIFH